MLGHEADLAIVVGIGVGVGVGGVDDRRGLAAGKCVWRPRRRPPPKSPFLVHVVGRPLYQPWPASVPHGQLEPPLIAIETTIAVYDSW